MNSTIVEYLKEEIESEYLRNNSRNIDIKEKYIGIFSFILLMIGNIYFFFSYWIQNEITHPNFLLFLGSILICFFISFTGSIALTNIYYARKIGKGILNFNGYIYKEFEGFLIKSGYNTEYFEKIIKLARNENNNPDKNTISLTLKEKLCNGFILKGSEWSNIYKKINDIITNITTNEEEKKLEEKKEFNKMKEKLIKEEEERLKKEEMEIIKNNIYLNNKLQKENKLNNKKTEENILKKVVSESSVILKTPTIYGI